MRKKIGKSRCKNCTENEWIFVQTKYWSPFLLENYDGSRLISLKHYNLPAESIKWPFFWKTVRLFVFVLKIVSPEAHKQNARSRWTPLIWPPMMQSILSSVNCGNLEDRIKRSSTHQCASFLSSFSFGIVRIWQAKRSERHTVNVQSVRSFCILLLSVQVFCYGSECLLLNLYNANRKNHS